MVLQSMYCMCAKPLYSEFLYYVMHFNCFTVPSNSLCSPGEVFNEEMCQCQGENNVRIREASAHRHMHMHNASDSCAYQYIHA